ncbi:hypothetical protein GC175_27635 [bacterium]|nr:hypothetical protein [bacterium]
MTFPKSDRFAQSAPSAFYLFAVVLAMFLFGSASSTVSAQGSTNPLSMQVTAAFDGYFKYGEWLPIWVELENQGRDLNAQVQVQINSRSGQITYATPAELPGGARKRIVLYVPPNSFSRELTVNLVDVGNPNAAPVLSRAVTVQPLSAIHFLVGIVAPERGALSQISSLTLPGQPRPISLVDISLADLPDRVDGLRSFELLILNNTDTSNLTPEQVDVLTGWVEAGGRLVIGGGAGALTTAAGLPDALLPLRPQSLVDMDSVPALATYADDAAIRVPGPFAVARGTVDGTTLVAEDDIPLLVERPLGQGAVHFVALDVTSSPFDAWAGLSDFWLNLLGPGVAYPDFLPPDISPDRMRAEQMEYPLSMLPSLDLPSVRNLTILLGIYILLVGPVNYLVLRQMRRLQWAWATIPLITLIFSGGAFGIGYALRGDDLILNKIALIRPTDGGITEVTSYMGLFSPAQDSYEIVVDGEGLLSPLARNADPWNSGAPTPGNEMVIIQGQPSRLRGLNINQWSMRSFMQQTRWDDFGAIDADFRFNEDGIIGEVVNRTDFPLTDVTVVWGEQFTRIGDIAAGGSVAATLEMTQTSDVMLGSTLAWRLYQPDYTGGPPNREVELKRTVLDNLLQGSMGFDGFMQATASAGEIFLIGWFNEAPPVVEVPGQLLSRQTTALYYTSFAYPAPEAGPFSLPPGLLANELVEMPVEGGTCGPTGNASIFLNRGDAIFDFTVPPDFRDSELWDLHLSLRTDGGWMNAPDTALYNWDDESWLALDSPQLGINDIAFVDGLMNDEGKIRLRVSAQANGGGCIYLGMGISGTKP